MSGNVSLVSTRRARPPAGGVRFGAGLAGADARRRLGLMSDATAFPQHIIARKRDGRELTRGEIAAFVRGATEGTWADYQLAALLMAIFLRGMTAAEWVATTDERAMRLIALHQHHDRNHDERARGGKLKTHEPRAQAGQRVARTPKSGSCRVTSARYDERWIQPGCDGDAA